MTIDDIRIMAMNRRQTKREQERLAETEFDRKKTEENGSNDDPSIPLKDKGNDGDHTREKEYDVIAETK